MQAIEFQHNTPLQVADIVRVFNASGITRPTHDAARIEKMFVHANLIVSAWHNGVLIALVRGLTDHSYCCYLSDLAVDKAYQHQGVGEALLKQVRQVLSPEVSLVLLSAPSAMAYYPKVGFSTSDNAFIIKRER
ncbi:GNAT family N-acetyltransferase [Limnohabitans sp.]|uniref:GNAT family N-acetyltransferase n=1 Tax=Limnohabitans sp. TaxID=1907725 RepID=UPI00286F0DB1|nr:GNAT family N-acetyltransferase [Limnohabitans sp.]